MKKLFCLLLFSFFITSLLHAQERPLSTKNKKAIEHYRNAQRYYDSRQNDNAVAELHAAIKEDTSFIEAHGILAYVYEDMGKMEDGIKELKKVLNINPHFSKTLHFTVAEMELNIGRYQDALQDFEMYQQHPVSDPDIEYKARIGMIDCKFAVEAMKHPVPFDPKNMGININSEYSEYLPAITADGETFLFTRRIPDNTRIEGVQEDFYVSYKINGEWTKAMNIGPPLNTEDNEGAPTLSSDGHLLIFTGCQRDGGHGSCDLYYSYKRGKNWAAGINLGSPVNTKNWETQPSLSSDGKTLYFIRGTVAENAIKNPDIYMTQLNDSGYWSQPERLSDTINTPDNEESVFIADDNQTLYFSSNGHPGMGGQDLYVSRRLPNGRWGIPKNLGYPINTSKDETSILVDPNGHLAYFASDRDGGYGGYDFYSYELYDSIRPKPITYTKGKVYDAKTNLPLVAQFTLIDLHTGKVVAQSSSAVSDGTFLVCLPLNKDYALNVSRKGYLFYSENFSLTDANASSTQPYMLDIPLQPIDTGATIILKNIFFETDKYNLKRESEIELNKLVNFLDANPTVKIQISGHTDNTGTIPHNNELSKNRAKSVYDYLVAHTISADRLSYKGYGQSRPIADNSTEAGKAKNRRTEMKIVAK